MNCSLSSASDLVACNHFPLLDQKKAVCVAHYLPDELLDIIFKTLPLLDLRTCLRVCKRWRSVCQHSSLWTPHLSALAQQKLQLNEDLFHSLYDRCRSNNWQTLRWNRPIQSISVDPCSESCLAWFPLDLVLITPMGRRSCILPFSIQPQVVRIWNGCIFACCASLSSATTQCCYLWDPDSGKCVMQFAREGQFRYCSQDGLYFLGDDEYLYQPSSGVNVYTSPVEVTLGTHGASISQIEHTNSFVFTLIGSKSLKAFEKSSGQQVFAFTFHRPITNFTLTRSSLIIVDDCELHRLILGHPNRDLALHLLLHYPKLPSLPIVHLEQP